MTGVSLRVSLRPLAGLCVVFTVAVLASPASGIPGVMTLGDATGTVRHALWKRYGAAFDARRDFSESRDGLSRTRWRCRVDWRTATLSYRGFATAWLSGGSTHASLAIHATALPAG